MMSKKSKRRSEDRKATQSLEPYVMTRAEMQKELQVEDCPCCRWVLEDTLENGGEIWVHPFEER